MKKTNLIPFIAVVLILTLSWKCQPQSAKEGIHWPLKQSKDKRYLTDQAGKPFFINGETAWKLLNALSREQMDQYLDHCIASGFNTVLFVFKPFQGETDAYGQIPFINDDISRPNEVYWQNVDSLVAKAKARDILLFGVMLWHKDDQNAINGNRRNPLKYSLEQCRTLGRFLGSRYHPDKSRGNVIFVGGGDKRPGPDTARYRVMAEAVLEVNPQAILTYHAYHPSSSCDQWGYPDWLKLNGIYNYQPPHSPEWIWEEARNNWLDHGGKMPIMLYEGLYENESRKGYRGTPFNIRKQHWWAVTSGCTAGHAFGHRNIWTMNEWSEHLGDEARMDIQHISNLMNGLEWWLREPDLNNNLLIGGLGNESSRATACLAKDGSYAMVYTPNKEDPELDLSHLKLPVRIYWYNPRTGDFIDEAQDIRNAGKQVFQRPDTLDWVLLLMNP